MLIEQVGILCGLLVSYVDGAACLLVAPDGIQRIVEATDTLSTAAAGAVGTEAEPREELARFVVELLVVAAAEHCAACGHVGTRSETHRPLVSPACLPKDPTQPTYSVLP